MIFWIASYPKSGNTWVRSLLSSYYFTNDGIFNQKLLANIEQFPQKKFFADFKYNSSVVGDTAKHWIKAQEKINLDNKIRFLKTHNSLSAINGYQFTNPKNTIGCIYVIRDPRNVITSLKNHFELNNEEAMKFMMNEKKFTYDFHALKDYSDFQFISSWENNYKSWKNQILIPVKFIKYEDLIDKTFIIFKEIVEFINKLSNVEKKFNKKKALNSVRTTSFNNLSNLEKRQGFIESLISKDEKKKIPFFHLGPENDWKKMLDENLKKKLFDIFQENLKDLSYL
ncbi:sulfotransferase domain-containing protein [Candidatus Pelagibacter ubique]|uniref:sulfotransferase domain-containing protein n=1 Tax=Pelagibacter ubique TaxID=198252 RepID=UPI0003D1A088